MSPYPFHTAYQVAKTFLRKYVLIFLVLFSSLNAIAMDIDATMNLTHKLTAQTASHHHHHDDAHQHNENQNNELQNQSIETGHSNNDHVENTEDCSEHKHCAGHSAVYVFTPLLKNPLCHRNSAYSCANVTSNYQTLLKSLYRPPIA